MTTSVSYQREGQVATLLLEAMDGKPPTLDGGVLQDLERCLDRVIEDRVRVVFLRSYSDRYFCVGANINVLKETDEQTIGPWVMEGHRVLNALEDLPVPVVAVVEGYAMGGGLELAMACDLIFASDTARLAQSEAGLGFIPGWGGTLRLAERIGFAKAKYWFYSGRMIEASEALEIGLVEFSGEKADLEAECSRFAEEVIANSQNALEQFKAILNGQRKQARNENVGEEASRSVSCLQAADTKQRLQDFLNKKGRK